MITPKLLSEKGYSKVVGAFSKSAVNLKAESLLRKGYWVYVLPSKKIKGKYCLWKKKKAKKP